MRPVSLIILALAVLGLVAALFLSPLPLIALAFIGLIVLLVRLGPTVGKIVAVTLVALVAGLYFRLAGFRSDSLDQAHKYGGEIWPSFSHRCTAPNNYRMQRSIVDGPRVLREKEVTAVASSSHGYVWFSGPPCHTESPVGLTLSWLAFALIPLYAAYLLMQRRILDRPAEEALRCREARRSSEQNAS